MRPIGLARGEWTTIAIETHHPDVVVLDVHLPGLNGLEILEIVRRRCEGHVRSARGVTSGRRGRPAGEIAIDWRGTARRPARRLPLEAPFRPPLPTTRCRENDIMLLPRGDDLS